MVIFVCEHNIFCIKMYGNFVCVHYIVIFVWEKLVIFVWQFLCVIHSIMVILVIFCVDYIIFLCV